MLRRSVTRIIVVIGICFDTMFYSSDVFLPQTMTVHIAFVTEDSIARNICYMLLGLETSMFTIHQSTVITAKTENVLCMHFSPWCLRNILKKFASLGTRVNRLRTIGLSTGLPVWLARFLRQEASEILNNFNTKIESVLLQANLLLTEILSVTQKLSGEIDSFCRFVDLITRATDMDSTLSYHEMTERMIHNIPCNLSLKLKTYITNNTVQFITSEFDFDVPANLQGVREDVNAVLSRLKNKAEFVLLLKRTDIANMSGVTLESFKAQIGFEKLVRLVRRICFLSQADFAEDFMDYLGEVGPDINRAKAVDAFIRALGGYCGDSTMKFSVRVDGGEVGITVIPEHVVMRLLIDEQTIDVVEGISRTFFRLRWRLRLVNRLWHPLSRCGNKAALQLRAKLSIALQRTLHDLYQIVNKEGSFDRASSVLELCWEYRDHMKKLSDELALKIDERLLENVDSFLISNN